MLSAFVSKTRSLITAVINIKTTIAKAVATGVVNSAKEVIAANDVYDYCSKSAALYKKD